MMAAQPIEEMKNPHGPPAGFDFVQKEFTRRCRKKEIPLSSFVLYLNGSIMLVGDVELTASMLDFGLTR